MYIQNYKTLNNIEKRNNFNMKQTIEIEVPKDWSAVSLKDYLAFRKDMEAYKDEPEALIACMFHHLCHFPVQYLQSLDIETYTAVRDDLFSFIQKLDYPLTNVPNGVVNAFFIFLLF